MISGLLKLLKCDIFSINIFPIKDQSKAEIRLEAFTLFHVHFHSVFVLSFYQACQNSTAHHFLLLFIFLLVCLSNSAEIDSFVM